MNIQIYLYWVNSTNTNTNNIQGPFYSNIQIFLLITGAVQEVEYAVEYSVMLSTVQYTTVKRNGIQRSISLTLQEFPQALPLGTPSGKGLYLTV